MAGSKLTPKQAAFVREYLVDLNGAAAAVRAGYAAKSSHVEAARLLANASVRAAVDKALETRADRVELKADDVLREIQRIYSCDIADAFDEQGRLLPLKDMPLDVRRCISGIETDELYAGGGEMRVEIGQTRKVKFWPKDKALDMAMRHLGKYRDKVEVSVDASLEQLVLAAVKKRGGR